MSTYFRTSHTKEEKGYANFEGNHWHLVMLVDKHMAFAPLMDLNNQFKFALVAIFVLSTIISFLFFSTIYYCQGGNLHCRGYL